MAIYRIKRFSQPIRLRKPEIRFKTESRETHESYDLENPKNNYRIDHKYLDSSEIPEPQEELNIEHLED